MTGTRTVAALRLRPDARLVDLGCGRGGPGLWLARALSVRLTGIDFSAAAVEIATQRAADFVAPDRAEFRQGSFERTGLPDGYADGLLSVDALPFSPDRQAALQEAARILVSGGRFVLTAREQPGEIAGHPQDANQRPPAPASRVDFARPGRCPMWTPTALPHNVG